MNSPGARQPVLILAMVASVMLSAAAGRATSTEDLGKDKPQPVLVELFTSEGCSTCPPADRLLAELDHQQDVQGALVVVLSEHVDYWNQLGWRDPYSLPDWTDRQNAYGRQFHLQSVYTPQAVVDGSRQVLGSNAPELRQAILDSESRKKVDLAILAASWNGNHLEVEINADAATNAALYAVIADDMDRSSVDRGENKGQDLTHVAVARVLKQLASLHGATANGKFNISFPKQLSKEHLRLVVFIQDKSNGRVLGIANREL